MRLLRCLSIAVLLPVGLGGCVVAPAPGYYASYGGGYYSPGYAYAYPRPYAYAPPRYYAPPPRAAYGYGYGYRRW